MFISPAENHPLLKGLGEVSTECEKRGVDFMWVGKGGLYGVQRKEVHDLVASRGDRLPRELGQMAGSDLVRAFLLVEGDTTGEFIAAGRHSAGLTRARFIGMLMSLQCEWNVGVMMTSTIADTAETLTRMKSWTQKNVHGSLSQRSKSRAVWGTQKSREFGIHLLQGLDGLSVGRAGAIYDHFGHAPIGWTVTREELVSVVGLGKKTVEKIWSALVVEDAG